MTVQFGHDEVFFMMSFHEILMLTWQTFRERFISRAWWSGTISRDEVFLITSFSRTRVMDVAWHFAKYLFHETLWRHPLETVCWHHPREICNWLHPRKTCCWHHPCKRFIPGSQLTCWWHHPHKTLPSNVHLSHEEYILRVSPTHQVLAELQLLYLFFLFPLSQSINVCLFW